MSLRTRALEAREIHQLIKNGQPIHAVNQDHIRLVFTTEYIHKYIDVCEHDFEIYLIVYDRSYFPNERETCRQIKAYFEKWT